MPSLAACSGRTLPTSCPMPTGLPPLPPEEGHALAGAAQVGRLHGASETPTSHRGAPPTQGQALSTCQGPSMPSTHSQVTSLLGPRASVAPTAPSAALRVACSPQQPGGRQPEGGPGSSANELGAPGQLPTRSSLHSLSVNWQCPLTAGGRAGHTREHDGQRHAACTPPETVRPRALPALLSIQPAHPGAPASAVGLCRLGPNKNHSPFRRPGFSPASLAQGQRCQGNPEHRKEASLGLSNVHLKMLLSPGRCCSVVRASA